MQRIISVILIFIHISLFGLVKPIEAFAMQYYADNVVVSNSFNKQKTVVKYLDEIEKYSTFIKVNQTKISDNSYKNQNFNFGFDEDFVKLSEKTPCNLYFSSFLCNNFLTSYKYKNIKYLIFTRAP